MIPKPKHIRKISSSSSDMNESFRAEKVDTKDTKELMPPPPNPPPPLRLLEAEVNQLAQCLKNITLKTSQVLKFYLDTKNLEIQPQIPYPPRTLTTSLTSETAKYDQICDALDVHLLRAINVLKRDLLKEENRAREAEALAKMIATQAELLSHPRTGSNEADPAIIDPMVEYRSNDSNSVRSGVIGKGTQARRQSKILSLSTLHRPAFPLKLDLSSAALRFIPDEITRSAITSPVTLAPKSARPTATNELPPDLLAAFTTNPNDSNFPAGLGDSTQGPGLTAGQNSIQTELGTTAEKPIELDLDMDVGMGNLDLFGDDIDGRGNLSDESALFGTNTNVQEVTVANSEMGLLEVYNAVGGHEEAIFESLGSTIGDTSNSSTNILAQLATENADINAHADNSNIINNASSFDYQSLGMDDIPDFNSNFFNSSDGGVEMSELLTMGTATQTHVNESLATEKS